MGITVNLFYLPKTIWLTVLSFCRLQQRISLWTVLHTCPTQPWDVWAQTQRSDLASLLPSPVWRVLMKQVSAMVWNQLKLKKNQSSSSSVLSTSTIYINIYSRKLFQKLFSVYVSVCVPKCYKYNPITFNGQSFVNKHHKCFIIKSVEIKVIFQSQRWGFDSSSVPLCSTARHEWEMLSGKAVLGHMCRVVTSWKGCS